MNFISIHQYFNKLQIVFLSLMILPLLAFIAIYLLSDLHRAEAGIEYFIVIPVLALLEWVLGKTIFNKKIKSARNAQGLGAKLDKYSGITIVRYCFVSSAGLILAAGFFLTQSAVFGALYLTSLLMSVFYWPTGPRVSGELMLRGDEKEMVYFKKDTLL